MGKSLNGKELGKGISQRKDGLYQARFVNRFGKRETLYGKTYSEITKKLRDSQYNDEKMLNVVSTKMTLDEWFDIWLTTCKKNCRDTTKYRYTKIYKGIKEELGWRQLESLNLVIVQEAFNHLKNDSLRHHAKSVLVNMLNCAVDADLLIKNVALKINTKIDGTERKERRVLTEEEIEVFCNTTKDSSYYPIFIVALNTGMRLGEILGLTWDCVDFERGVIEVNKTLCHLPNNGKTLYELHKPKTSSGERSIPMSVSARDVLLYQRKRCETIYSMFDPEPGFENLVFITKKNRPIADSDVRRGIHEFVSQINEKYPDMNFESFSPHCFRHTFATHCIAQGMKPKVLQKILGHSTLQMTMDLYCHVLDDTIRNEMSLIAEMV